MVEQLYQVRVKPEMKKVYFQNKSLKHWNQNVSVQFISVQFSSVYFHSILFI